MIHSHPNFILVSLIIMEILSKYIQPVLLEIMHTSFSHIIFRDFSVEKQRTKKKRENIVQEEKFFISNFDIQMAHGNPIKISHFSAVSL